MADLLQNRIDLYARRRSCRKRWKKAVAVLAVLTIICTSYQLILPATTMGNAAYCGFDEHPEHTEECTQAFTELTCELAENGHLHSEECFGVQSILSCGRQETEGHEHGEICFEDCRLLSCGLDESAGHIHSDECINDEGEYYCGQYDGEGEHYHDGGCFTVGSVLTCGKEEREPHNHDESCYEQEISLICGLDEREPHEHTDSCYASGEEVICTKPVHEHSLQCFSNPDADVENAEIWKQIIASVNLSGNWNTDVLAIARRQLGYTESTENYLVLDDGTSMKGYTRYGDWYGDPYGDWSAMFVSFCLKYAGVDTGLIPLEANCENWVSKLASGAYEAFYYEYTNGSNAPVPGDLIFFNLDHDTYNAARTPNHVGLVASVITDSNGQITKLQTIEGNSSDCVRYVTYSIDDNSIMGFGRLPENPDMPDFALNTRTGSGFIITITGNHRAIDVPVDEVELVASEITDMAAKSMLENKMLADGVAFDTIVYLDISLIHNGEIIEPIGEVRLTIDDAVTDADNLAVYHIDTDNGTVTDMDAVLENGEVALDTDHFSTYALAYDSSAGGSKNVTATISADWNSTQKAVTNVVVNAKSTQDKMYFTLQYKASEEVDWIDVSWSVQTKANTEIVLSTVMNDGTDVLSTAGINSKFRVKTASGVSETNGKNIGYTSEFSISALLENVKPGFAAWLASDYGSTFNQPSPTSTQDLYRAFEIYYELPMLTITHHFFAESAGSMRWTETLRASITNQIGQFLEPKSGYRWEYLDDNNIWQPLTAITDDTICESAEEYLETGALSVLNGGGTVRCTATCMFGSGETAVEIPLVSNEIELDPEREYNEEFRRQVLEGTIPTVALSCELDASNPEDPFGWEVSIVAANSDEEGSYTYTWQYRDEDGNWVNLASDSSNVISEQAELFINDPEHNSMFSVLNGGGVIRCAVYSTDTDGNSVLVNYSDELTIDPEALFYNKICEQINEELGLESYMVRESGGASKTIDLRINGYRFTNFFYYGNIAKDKRVPFSDAQSYANYLAKTYLSDGISAAAIVWQTYLFDLYDPNSDLGMLSHYSLYYPGKLYGGVDQGGSTYGDERIEWPKDSGSSFHTSIETNRMARINPLNYDFLENGTDYSLFITGLDKSAAADAAGDANMERGYEIKLEADAQASVTAPVVMLITIQTSWQMFDYAHANCVVGDGTYTTIEVGSGMYNTSMANLYDIKQALLRYVDYMQSNFPGNNLFLGINEVQHGGSGNMINGLFTSTSINKKGQEVTSTIPLYVTNDYETLRSAILAWDVFGNCEHVHYDTDALVTALNSLESTLASLCDAYDKPISYDDIRKVSVIIGGGTENTEGTNGYACTLPWGTFRTNKLNSVYGIRINSGTPLNSAKVMSWLDYYKNNSGAPYSYSASGFTGNTDGTGNFTDKAVCTSEDAIFNYLVQISRQEMSSTGLTLTAVDRYVDDVAIADTVKKEFAVDTTSLFSAAVKNRDGSIQSEVLINIETGEITLNSYTYDGSSPKIETSILTGTVEQAIDPSGKKESTLSFEVSRPNEDGSDPVAQTERLTLTENLDGTTEVNYLFGRVYSLKTVDLQFHVNAREDYLGSNNVFTNVGTPSLEYSHYRIDGTGRDIYDVSSADTPQVNVPLSVEVMDGDSVTLIMKEGEKSVSQNLGALSKTDDLNMAEITESLLELYDQINGALTYTWTLDDGTVIPIGTVTVQDGIIIDVNIENGSKKDGLPDLKYEYVITKAGNYTPQLEVTFTPEPVDTTTGNFKDDGKTAIAVNSKNDTGRVKIDVILASTKTTFIVRKVWQDQGEIIDHSKETIHFTLLQNGNPYSGQYNNSLSEENSWEVLIENLPQTVTIGGAEEIAIYSVQENDVPEKYKVEYSEGTDTETVDEYKARLTVNVTTTGDVNKKWRITYIYNGAEYIWTSSTAIQIKSRTGSLIIDDLSVNEENEPYSFTVTKVEAIEDNGSVSAEKVQKLISNYEGAVSSYATGGSITNETAVKIITNTLNLKTMVIRKLVIDGVTDLKFEFIASIAGDSFVQPPENAGYTIDGNGIVHFSLAHGESVTIFGIPVGAEVTISEIAHDGYYPFYKQGNQTIENGDTVTLSVLNNTEIDCVNTAGYELPETGGPGTGLYTFGGILLSGTALMLGFGSRRRRERRIEK